MILVFGQSGQVAQELQRLAPDALFLDRGRADLSEPESCAQAIRDHAPDAVINAAAYTAVDRAEEEEELAAVVNGHSPAAMAQSCAALGVPLVQLSTDYVFDGSGQTAFATDHPTSPLGAYGRTKLLGEEAVRAADGIHAVLRTSWVFSSHGANFVKTMLRLGKERDRLTVVADQIGGPTAAQSIAAACLTIAQGLRDASEKSGTYHISGAPAVSWAEFARAIMAEARLDCQIDDIPTSAYPTPARRPLNSRLDCRELTRFGLAQPDWRADLKTVIAELRGKA